MKYFLDFDEIHLSIVIEPITTWLQTFPPTTKQPTYVASLFSFCLELNSLIQQITLINFILLHQLQNKPLCEKKKKQIEKKQENRETALLAK